MVYNIHMNALRSLEHAVSPLLPGTYFRNRTPGNYIKVLESLIDDYTSEKPDQSMSPFELSRHNSRYSPEWFTYGWAMIGLGLRGRLLPGGFRETVETEEDYFFVSHRISVIGVSAEHVNRMTNLLENAREIVKRAYR